MPHASAHQSAQGITMIFTTDLDLGDRRPTVRCAADLIRVASRTAFINEKEVASAENFDALPVPEGFHDVLLDEFDFSLQLLPHLMVGETFREPSMK
jgi:hypothetical protein